MITNLIRKALAPSIEMILNVERIRLNEIINDMENAVDNVKSIRARDIADNINTYDIAADISLDSYDIASNIEIDASDIEVDTRELAERISREIGSNISIDASDIEVDTSDLVDRICEQIGCNITVDEQNIEIDYSALGRHIVGGLDIDVSDINIDYQELARQVSDYVDLNEVNARINNVHTYLQTVERKMDLILKHLGITPENA